MIWIIWLLFILIDAFLNNWLIVHKMKIMHGLNATYRFIVAVLLALSFGLISPDYKQLIMFMLGGFFSFWLIFNPVLNKLRGLPFDYLGKTAILDKLEATAQTPIFIWKIMLAIAFIYGYYNTNLL